MLFIKTFKTHNITLCSCWHPWIPCRVKSNQWFDEQVAVWLLSSHNISHVSGGGGNVPQSVVVTKKKTKKKTGNYQVICL